MQSDGYLYYSLSFSSNCTNFLFFLLWQDVGAKVANHSTITFEDKSPKVTWVSFFSGILFSFTNDLVWHYHFRASNSLLKLRRAQVWLINQWYQWGKLILTTSLVKKVRHWQIEYTGHIQLGFLWAETSEVPIQDSFFMFSLFCGRFHKHASGFQCLIYTSPDWKKKIKKCLVIVLCTSIDFKCYTCPEKAM